MFNIPLSNILNKQSSIHIIGKDINADLAWLLKECKEKIKHVNEENIKKAFLTSVEIHKNKVRKSGLPAYTHALAVADILINEIPLDESSVIAALLHDVLEESDSISIKDIRSEFGNVVAEIVEGVWKIDHIESQNQAIDQQIENYRKLLLSLFHDIRIILIKLADRLHNMRTLEHVSIESQKKLATETVEIYAPFANRFGLRNIKWELEDLSFKFMNKESYEDIKLALNSTREEREDYIKKFLAPINDKLQKDEILKKMKIHTEVKGRPKHIYSIFNKMNLRQKNIDELYDLFAIRVIVETVEPAMCFYVYGLISSIYIPVPETFKDYISSPKKNGYKSIHTAVVGPDKKIVEVQIRTNNMDLIAENGLAAHFRYKSGKVDAQSILEDSNILEWISNVRKIFENADGQTSEELIESLKSNLFFDEIYVYTINHEFLSLPKDSMPLDFAFEIASENGLNYVASKVNGKIVPIDYKLKSGDQVEILTSPNQKPITDWLRFCVSSKAKSAINEYLNNEKQLKIENGKTKWEEVCKKKKLNLTEHELSYLLSTMRLDNVDEFYIKLVDGDIDLDYTIHFITYKLKDGTKSGSIKLNNMNDDYIKEKRVEKFTFNELNHIELKVLDRSNLLNEISNLFLAVKNIQFIKVKFEIIDGVFLLEITFKIFTKEELNHLLESINTLGGLQSINIIEN